MAKELTSYERKIQVILDTSLGRFKNGYTPEQYELELTVAKSILATLGVHP